MEKVLVLDTNQAENNYLMLRELGPFSQGIGIGLDPTKKFLVFISWFIDTYSVQRRIFPSYLNKCIIMRDKRAPWRCDEKNRVFDTQYAIGNGEQTASVLDYESFERVMIEWDYKFDAPRFTARITALCNLFHYHRDPFSIEMSIIKKSSDGDNCIREFFYPKLNPGFSVCLNTYVSKDKSFPIQEGEPFVIPIKQNGNQVDFLAENIWNSLNVGKVCLLVACRGIYSREFFLRAISNPVFEVQTVDKNYS